MAAVGCDWPMRGLSSGYAPATRDWLLRRENGLPRCHHGANSDVLASAPYTARYRHTTRASCNDMRSHVQETAGSLSSKFWICRFCDQIAESPDTTSRLYRSLVTTGCGYRHIFSGRSALVCFVGSDSTELLFGFLPTLLLAVPHSWLERGYRLARCTAVVQLPPRRS